MVSSTASHKRYRGGWRMHIARTIVYRRVESPLNAIDDVVVGSLSPLSSPKDHESEHVFLVAPKKGRVEFSHILKVSNSTEIPFPLFASHCYRLPRPFVPRPELTKHASQVPEEQGKVIDVLVETLC
jgi:hypothetical protein